MLLRPWTLGSNVAVWETGLQLHLYFLHLSLWRYDLHKCVLILQIRICWDRDSYFKKVWLATQEKLCKVIREMKVSGRTRPKAVAQNQCHQSKIVSLG